MSEKIIDKAKKLFAHSESARSIGNTAEAEAFAVKVQEILNRHNLSLSNLEIEKEKAEGVGYELVNLVLQKIDVWQCHLLCVIAEVNGCFAVEHEDGYQIIIGRKNDRKVVIEFYRYFEKLGYDLLEKKIKERNENKLNQSYFDYSRGYVEPFFGFGFPLRSPQTSESEYRKSFLIGFAQSLTSRLVENRLENNPTEETQTSTALTFFKNKTKESEDWARKNLEIEERAESASNLDAFKDGTEIGQQVALTNKTIK